MYPSPPVHNFYFGSLREKPTVKLLGKIKNLVLSYLWPIYSKVEQTNIFPENSALEKLINGCYVIKLDIYCSILKFMFSPNM